MAIEDQLKDEKRQYEINREAAKISVLSSGKTNKFEYLIGEEILPSEQIRTTGEAKINLFSFGKNF